MVPAQPSSSPRHRRAPRASPRSAASCRGRRERDRRPRAGRGWDRPTGRCARHAARSAPRCGGSTTPACTRATPDRRATTAIASRAGLSTGRSHSERLLGRRRRRPHARAPRARYRRPERRRPAPERRSRRDGPRAWQDPLVRSCAIDDMRGAHPTRSFTYDGVWQTRRADGPPDAYVGR